MPLIKLMPFDNFINKRGKPKTFSIIIFNNNPKFDNFSSTYSNEDPGIKEA